MLLYTDDCLSVSEHPKQELMVVNKNFPSKPESVGPPRIYLGAKLSKVQLQNGVEAYAMSMSPAAEWSGSICNEYESVCPGSGEECGGTPEEEGTGAD